MTLSLIVLQLYTSLFLYVAYSILALRQTYLGYTIKNKRILQWYFYFLVLNIIVYCQGGDYWSIRLWFYDTKTKAFHENIEQIYFYIASCLPSIYILFRFVIWGGGLFILKKICDKLNINVICVLSLFGILYIEHYAYARASLGIIMAIWGYGLLCISSSKQRTIFYYIKIICIFLVSCSLHKSIIGLWLILFCSYFLKFNKKTLLMLILLYIPISYLFNNIIVPYIILFVDLNNTSLNTNYISGNFLERDLSGLIKIHISSLIMLGYCFFKMSKHQLPFYIERFVMATIFIIYIASLFLSLEMGNSNTTALRFFLMAYPTGILSCSYAIQERIVPRRLIFAILLWGAFYSAYLYYKNISNPEYINYTYIRSRISHY